MFTKLKSALRDYFLPQYPNDEFVHYMNEYGAYSYYNPTEPDILKDEIGTSYAQPFIEKP